jgi:COP9 signalosome complex subunit 7
MSKTNQLSEGIALQQHVKTAQGLKNDTALVNLIKQVLSAPDIFVFGELLALDSIKSLSKKSGEPQQHYELLEIFAYGKYSQYKDRQHELPKLTEKQSKKLKQLTIASLASDNHVIPYSLLLKELDIAELRELEDLIIDALYKDIVVGKLDHERQVFQVDSSIGRDLRPEDMDRMIATLLSWQHQSDILLKNISESMNNAQARRTEAQNHKRDFEKKLEEAKGHVKIVMESEMASGVDPELLMGNDMSLMGIGMGNMGGMDRGGGGHMRHKQKKGGRGRQHIT